MSEAKRTPGHWRTSKNTVDIYHEDGFTVAELNQYGTHCKEQAYLDRCLMAAAPEMLEALIAERDWTNEKERVHAAKLRHAAIAKAKGESHE